MERAKQIILQGILQPYFAGDIMVKLLINIDTVISLRRCRHSQKKLWREIVYYLLITVRTRPVTFVQYDN